jgi:hypothetical protein
MCLMGSQPKPEPVKKTPILPGPESEDDKVNDATVENQTDRSKQDEARGRDRDYRGKDDQRHFDEEEARKSLN